MKPRGNRDDERQQESLRRGDQQRGQAAFPQAGITKGALADYYATLGTIFLNVAGDRPITLVHCPDGIGGDVPVATPIEWSELDVVSGANAFTIRDADALRARAASTPLAGWGEAKQSLPDY